MASRGRGWTARILLVMRRSGFRFPRAAQVNDSISLVCSVAVDRDGRSTKRDIPHPKRRVLGLEHIGKTVELLEPAFLMGIRARAGRARGTLTPPLAGPALWPERGE